jgi:hypothetical protein
MPDVFIYVQQEVLVMAHNPPPPLVWPKENLWPGGGTILARDNKDLCMSLMARPNWSEMSSTTLVRFFAVT